MRQQRGAPAGVSGDDAQNYTKKGGLDCNVDIRSIATVALQSTKAILNRWLPGGKYQGCEYIVRNPRRDDKRAGSFKINTHTGQWCDFATDDRGGDFISLVAYLDGMTQIDAAKSLADFLSIPHETNPTNSDARGWRPVIPIPDDAPLPPSKHSKLGRPTDLWVYRDTTGNAIVHVFRFDSDNGAKHYRPLTYCENGDGQRGWRWQNIPVPRPLYKLDRLTALPDATCVWCEGEKAADAAANLFPEPEYVTFTSMNGAKSPEKSDWSAMRGRSVILFPDHDDSGRTAVVNVRKGLAGASSVKTLNLDYFKTLPDGTQRPIPEKWDAADAMAEGFEHEHIEQFLKNPNAFTGPADNGGSIDDKAAIVKGAEISGADAQVIEKLAALNIINYDRQREAAAESLGIRVHILDQVVRERRHAQTERGKNGREIKLYEPKPWPAMVNGAEALDEGLGLIKKFMVIRDEHAIEAILWTCHTHIYDVFSHTPRLAITAPCEACGKTLLLYHIIGHMVPRPQRVEIMKPAPFFRMTEKFRPVWLIDECDAFIKQDFDLLAGINNGWEPYGGVVRCVGDDFEPRVFSTFSPVAVGGVKIQKFLPRTTLSRSLIVDLERAMPGEVGECYDPKKHKPLLLDIGRKLARWTHEHRDALATREPRMPEDSFNRNADKWRPLFAVAQLAGDRWPDLVKNAYFWEERDQKSNAKLSTALQLLEDIKEVFGCGEDEIKTHDLIDRLCQIDESIWVDYNFREREGEKRKIQSRQISALLKPYHIKPTTIHRHKPPAKGYRKIPFEIAWQRYLCDSPYIPPILSVRPFEPSSDAASSDSLSVRNEIERTDRKTPRATAGAGSNGRTDKNPRIMENGDETIGNGEKL